MIFFGFKSCVPKKYEIVEIKDCKFLPIKLKSQNQPTRYNIKNDCIFSESDLPLVVDKPYTIIDGEGITITAPASGSSSANGFVLEGEKIILANLSMVGFTQPITVRQKSESTLLNVKLKNSYRHAVYIGNTQIDPPIEPPPIEQIEVLQQEDQLTVGRFEFLSLLRHIVPAARATGEACTAAAHTLESGTTESTSDVHASLLSCNVDIATVTTPPAIGILARGGNLRVDDDLSINNVEKGIFLPPSGTATIEFSSDQTRIGNYTLYGIGMDDFTGMSVSPGASIVLEKTNSGDSDICARAGLLALAEPNPDERNRYIINGLAFENDTIRSELDPGSEPVTNLVLRVNSCETECEANDNGDCEQTINFNRIDSQ